MVFHQGIRWRTQFVFGQDASLYVPIAIVCTLGVPAQQYPAGCGRSGAGAWPGRQGTGPSAAGGGIVPRNLRVCTRLTPPVLRNNADYLFRILLY